MENVTIMRNVRPGAYTVSLSCASGQHSTATLTVLGGGFNPRHGPHTGGGEMASTTGARIGLYGGGLALVTGLGIWLASGLRRRTA